MSIKGVHPNPKIVESVKNWKTPSTVKEFQQFISFCDYYRRFILKFSEVASPLSRLTRKDVSFVWNPECQTDFENLENALCKAPILSYPLPNIPFILDTDAFNVGIGAVLFQVQNGKEMVIAFGSKKLDKHQQRYSVTRRELLAVITFIHQYRHYLSGQKFLLRTDHGSLKWLFGFKDPQGQVARWLEFVSQFNFEIQHRPGVKHQNADALSRKDGENPLCTHQKDGQYKEDCSTCQSIVNDWSEFNCTVDNVGNISQNTFSCGVRAVTRSQNKKLTQSNRLDGYTTKEIETFQREDNDLKFIHQWTDNNIVPKRNEVMANSPSVRKYWLNFNLLHTENGVLYLKR